MNIKLIPILEDIKEKDFLETIKNKGYEGMKFKQGNHTKIKEILRERFITAHNKLDYESIGHPDFFIYNSKGYWFCEFKSKKDALRNEQLCWFLNHRDMPKAIAFVLSRKEKYLAYLKGKEKIPLTEQEKINQKVNRERWNKHDKIIDKYFKTHKPTTMRLNEYKKGKYCWVGIYPKDLVKELQSQGVW